MDTIERSYILITPGGKRVSFTFRDIIEYQLRHYHYCAPLSCCIWSYKSNNCRVSIRWCGIKCYCNRITLTKTFSCVSGHVSWQPCLPPEGCRVCCHKLHQMRRRHVLNKTLLVVWEGWTKFDLTFGKIGNKVRQLIGWKLAWIRLWIQYGYQNVLLCSM